MQDLVRLALLAAQMIAPPPAPPGRPAWIGIAGPAFVALFGGLALAFAIAALWLFLEPHLGGAGTALIIAVLALLAAGSWVWLLRRAPPATAAPARPVAATVVLGEAERLIRANLAPSLLAALLAGVLAGSSQTPRS